MDSLEFQLRSKQLAECIVSYRQNVHTLRVKADVEPGYLTTYLPESAPKDGEDWAKIMADVQNYIMPGITHWQHPQFHAYFPCGNSYPSILGDMLASAFGAVGFSWVACPAFTELEVVMMNWIGKMLGLQDEFLFSSDSLGGGVIQGSASECVLVCLLAARHKKLKELKQQNPKVDETILLSKLVAYTSQEAHSCVEKAAMIGFVKIRRLETDENYRLRGGILAEAIKEDQEQGLTPFFVSATLGTTSCCSFDDLTELGPLCEEHDIWLHVDAAYAGNALICPEFRYLSQGLEYASSFNVNLHKWLLVNLDCSLMWVKNKTHLMEPLTVDPIYLQHNQSNVSVDYRNWSIPLSRRFRSLKIWFVIRKFGIEKLQDHIRNHVKLAKTMENWIREDERFEVMNEVQTGLICFRLKGPNHLTETLLYFLNNSGNFFAVPAVLKGKYVIRLCINGPSMEEEDILRSWTLVTQTATALLNVGEVAHQQNQVNLKIEKENKYKKNILERSFSESGIIITTHPVSRKKRILSEILNVERGELVPLRC
ncbi:aromatic-L-amino-acid decarboxylase-like [Centruroides sculpturatus]|uniref:aromatic-L-amino-acid decarboxylase-like n=1 Tax=Centruroides sculpturatus TaxID=218467 RepID=UPI000C6D92DF|nr:aromatic-L-amino-acid decarboxylase-like [Centruroides sculpturatus]